MSSVLRFILILSASVFSCVSCIGEEVIDDDVVEKVPECLILYEGIETEQVSLMHTPHVATLVVRSNVAWSIRAEDPSWISFSLTHGRASEQGIEIVMTVSGNTTSESRKTDIVLKAGETEKRIAVVTAGTADIPVAEEAAVTAEILGNIPGL